MTLPTTLRTTLGTALILGAAASAHGQFSLDPATAYFVGTQPSGVAAGDYDGDGDMDLATTVDGPDRIVVLLNNGSGQYTLGPSSLLPNSSSPQDLVAGDLDGDFDIDLAVAVRDPAGAVVIMANGGAGTFAMSGSFSTGDRPRGLAIADIDQDNDLDLAVANRNSDTASVLTNNGAGSFSVATLATGAEPRATAFGNFDAVTGLDLAVTNHDARTISIFTNNGGTFSMMTTLSVGGVVRPDGITTADLDNDGDDDIIAATSDQTLNINQATVFMQNAGGFSFGGPFNYPTGGSNTSGVKAADFNCDGQIDIVTSNQDSGNVSILPNMGGGVFGPATIAAVGTTPEELVAADLDGDGDAEIVTANRDSGNLSVIINQTCTLCPADITGDGIVNVMDMLEVLSAWGQSGVPADINGDGIVNIFDLLDVLSAWGVC